MSGQSRYHTLLRASARLLAVLVMFGAMMVISQPTALAQPCSMADGCGSLTIFNCSNPPMPYDVEFLLCCGGTMAVSPLVNIPPTPCGSVSLFYVPPAGCTILGVWNVMPPWVPYTFDLASCTLVMY